MALLLLAVVLGLLFSKGFRPQALLAIVLAYLVGRSGLPFWFAVVVAVGAFVANGIDRGWLKSKNISG